MTYEILRDLGLITVLGTVIVTTIKIIFSQIKSVKFGVQALLRAQMIDDYNKWTERG